MTLDEFTGLPFEDAKATMLRCCGSEAWAVEMAAGRPYRTSEAVLEAAESQWWRLGEYGWMEAFRAHSHPPALGQLQDVQELLREYYATFGFNFILAEEGLPDKEIVLAIRERVENRPEQEIALAAEEEAKMTRQRLEELFAV